MLRDIEEIIRLAGGRSCVAARCKVTEAGVQKWARNGIPENRWAVIMALADAAHRREGGWLPITPGELHSINETIRAVPRRRAA